MNAVTVLNDLLQRGINLRIHEGSLQIDAPKGALTETDIKLIQEAKSEILLLIDRENVDGLHIHDRVTDTAELSPVQESMLLLDSMSGNIPYSNNCYGFSIDGPLNKQVMERTLYSIYADTEILRTVYQMQNDRKTQVILDPSRSNIVFEDLLGNLNSEQTVRTILSRETDYIFDLTSEAPIRVCLIRLDHQKFLLTFNIHQICNDGIGAVNFFKNLSVRYNLLMSGAEAPRANSGYQYRDYIAWFDGFKLRPVYHQSREYWARQLSGLPELHAFPTDFIRPSVQTFAGATYIQCLDGDTETKMDRFAAENSTTLFTVLQATLACLIAKYSDQSDIVIGTAAANRPLPEIQDMMGCFVNTLPFRYRLDMTWTVPELISHVREIIRTGLKHQSVSFDSIVNMINPRRSFSYNPLVQIMLVQQDDRDDDLTLRDTTVNRFQHQPDISRFDLTLHIYRKRNGVELHWEYSTELFHEATIERLALHFVTVLRHMMRNPESPLSRLSFYNKEPDTLSRKHVDDFPPPVMIHRLFERMSDATPSKVALRHDTGVKTYAELEAEANKLARWLRSQQGNNSAQLRVGVCMEKSPLLVTCMLAVFKAEGIYIPLDPSYPTERVRFMLSDSAVDILLTAPGFDTAKTSDIHARLQDASKVIATVTDASRLPVEQGRSEANPTDNPAYIIYTSGSTGKPKGVVVPHKSLFYSLHSNSRAMGISATDSIPSIGSQAFGISLLEILLPLISGGSVQLLSHDNVRDLDILIDKTRNVSVLHAVPSLMDKWLDRVEEHFMEYPNLRLLLVGGEAVPDKLLRRIHAWRADIKLLELYGMTESTVVCSSYSPGEDYAANYCIGMPHDTSRFYVLNDYLQLQPEGVPGQLYIGGKCLALGYLNQPELSAEKFIDNPFVNGEKLYKTGDRVRRLKDGKYEFLGRTDNQVNLRGVRIECGEIEALLTEHEYVAKAIVHVMTLEHGEPTLIAFVQPAQDNISEANLFQMLRSILENNLPDYMRPTVYQCVQSFPLNPNGKVDRKLLPKPTMEFSDAIPETATELKLHDLWAGFFGLDKIAVDANYFEIGGNSLLAAKIINKIKNIYSVEMSLTAIFEAPTIRSLSTIVDNRIEEKLISSLVYESTSDKLLADELLI